MIGVALVLARAPAAGERSPLLARSLGALRAIDGVGDVLLAGPPGVSRAPDEPARGDLRSATAAALAAGGADAVVVLHDPWCSPVAPGVFARALAVLDAGECVAVVAAAPATDTLKRASASGTVARTLDRSAMWELRTPQVHRAGALRVALDRPGGAGADAALARGDHGFLPALIDGPVRITPLPNDAIRVRDPRDEHAVERLLAR